MPDLTDVESRTATFLATERPELLDAFHRQLPRARRRTTGLLVAALVREGLLPRGVLGPDNILRIDLTVDQRLLVRVERERAFDRRRIGEVRLAGDGTEVVDPAALLTLLAKAGVIGGASWDELTAEVSESAANLAVSYACGIRRSRRLAALARRLGAAGVGELALRAAQAAPEELPTLTGPVFDRHLLFDRLCVEGHTIHPCGRSRGGMSPADSHRYATECAGETTLTLVAVLADHLSQTRDEQGRDVGTILFDHFPELGTAAMLALSAASPGKADAAAYCFVPVHTWQLEHVITRGYADEISSGVVVPLPDVRLPATPTVSLRTVVTAPGRTGRRLVVKTALDVLITTTRRSISPATTANGPRVSRLLARLVAHDSVLRARTAVVRETAGVCWQPPAEAVTGRGQWHARNLSALLREDPGDHASDGELALTGCALYASSPVTGRTVLADLVEQYRARQAPPLRPQEAALAVLAEYTELMLPTVLTFLVVYGIGLEAHLQNTVVVWRDGRPVRLLLRDFAGMRIYFGRLGDAGAGYTPHPDSITVVEEEDRARDKVFYAAVQANLAEVVSTLAEDFRMDEAVCWRQIRRQADRIFAELAARGPEQARRAAEDQEALYAPQLGQKAFLRMRLDPDSSDAYRHVANPLRD